MHTVTKPRLKCKDLTKTILARERECVCTFVRCYTELDYLQVQEYREDPLIYHGSLKAKWGASVVEAIKTIHQRVGEIRLPVFIMHSTADRLAPHTGSTFTFENISSDPEDKTFEVSYMAVASPHSWTLCQEHGSALLACTV